MDHSVPRLTANTTEKELCQPLQRDILQSECMYLSVMPADSTYHYRSASVF